MSLRNTVLAVLAFTLFLPVGSEGQFSLQLVSPAHADDDDDRGGKSRGRSSGRSSKGSSKGSEKGSAKRDAKGPSKGTTSRASPRRDRDATQGSTRESHEDLRKLFRFLGRKDDTKKATPRRRTSRPRSVTPAPVVAQPKTAYAPDEVISIGLQPEHITALTATGFSVLRSSTLGGDQTMHRLRKPAAMSLEDAVADVRQHSPLTDMNHFYRSEAAADEVAPAPACTDTNCLARDMIDWPEASSCGTPPKIGMIDTGLNAGHIALADASLTVHRLEMEAAQSGLMHGTSIASLLVGDTESRSPGLVPHMPLYAVDAFYSDGEEERSDGFSLIRALDWLADNETRIINLSLAGDDNLLLAGKIAEMEEKGILLIAAAGNNGPSAKPAFPAAYDTVVAVTAVDRRGQVYRRANRGEHIDLAAPGVEVWTAASISGARTKTGTSYAAPFVTATAALYLQSDPALEPSELRQKLNDATRDLGEEGRDLIYGNGLIDPPRSCE